MKTLVFDSSSLISLSESCIVSTLRFLKNKTGARFIAPESVFEESVGRPSKIKQYGFSAVRIKRLFFEGVMERVVVDGRLTEKVLSLANNLFYVGRVPLELIHLGEAECLAYAHNTNGMVIDEKTLRLLVEDPNKLRGLLKGEYGGRLVINEERLVEWQSLARGIKILRSAELVGVAAKQGYFKKFEDDEGFAYKSAIYALRGFGCSLTNDEMREFENTNVGR